MALSKEEYNPQLFPHFLIHVPPFRYFDNTDGPDPAAVWFEYQTSTHAHFFLESKHASLSQYAQPAIWRAEQDGRRESSQQDSLAGSEWQTPCDVVRITFLICEAWENRHFMIHNFISPPLILTITASNKTLTLPFRGKTAHLSRIFLTNVRVLTEIKSVFFSFHSNVFWKRNTHCALQIGNLLIGADR